MLISLALLYISFHTGSRLVPLAEAYNQNPKIYVDVECIHYVDPLFHGFTIYLPQQLLDVYLGQQHLPVIYAAAIPLNPGTPSIRKILFVEDIQDKVVSIDGLKPQSWYYLCLEFENMHRRERQGNTSTTCQLHRTLDKFGTRVSSLVSSVAYDGGATEDSSSHSGTASLRFLLQVAADFPIFLDIYLEQGPSAIQRYLLNQPKSIRIVFDELLHGFNYGRLCIRETPVLTAYSAIGRTISVSQVRCYLDDLKTAPLRKNAVAHSVRDIRNIESANSSAFTSASGVIKHRALKTALMVIVTFLYFQNSYKL